MFYDQVVYRVCAIMLLSIFSYKNKVCEDIAIVFFFLFLPMKALVAPSDAHLTGDQEIAGLIPAGSVNILLWRFIRKYFLQPFTPFR